MAFTKFATFDSTEILDIRSAPTRQRTATLDKFADYHNYRTSDGYIYARIRAISSRVNKNNDGWPSIELAGSPEIFDRHQSSEGGFVVEAAKGAKCGFATFVGKPIFVDHNNTDPEDTRGAIVDAKLHVEDTKTAAGLDPYYASAPDNHKPPTWVELLLEVDAKEFPKFAKALVDGAKDSKKGIDGFSMGCDVQHTICSHCDNKAESPEDFCEHIKLKGAHLKSKKTGKVEKAYEDCYGIKFFEISGVFDPADETALVREVRSSMKKEAPGNKHLPYATDKENRMYEHIKQSCLDRGGSEESCKREAASTVNKYRSEHGETKSNIRTADNAEPQDDHIRAPDPVDTLREDKICPICFVPGTMVRTKNGFEPIESISKGDLVLTHGGRFMPVTRVVETQFDGNLVKLDSGLITEPILTTPNHPFRTLLCEEHKYCQPSTCERSESILAKHRMGWSCADHLNKKSYLVEAHLKFPEDRQYVDIPDKYITAARRGQNTLELTQDLLWAFGLYIAEGSSHHREITYSLHKNEIEYRNKIINIFNGLGFKSRVTIRADRPNSAWVHIHSSKLAEWFKDWFGHGCDNKRIPSELFNLPDNKVQYIFQGILDGDGCTNNDTLRQTSSVLASQVIEIGHRLGQIKPTISIEKTEGKKPVYIIHNVASTGIKRTIDPIRQFKYGVGKWEFDGQILHRLASIDRVAYSGPVYNLEVEHDHTYVVQNVLVHNCGSNYDGHTCEVCGYVEPPEGLNNPDLEKAQEENPDLGSGDKQEEENVTELPEAEKGVPDELSDKKPGQSYLDARNDGVTSNVTNEMAWKASHYLESARINKGEIPILSGSPVQTNEPTEKIIKEPAKPPTARTASDFVAAAGATNQENNMGTTRVAADPLPDARADKRVDTTGIGGVIEDSNESASQADAQVDVTGIGGTGVTGVDADEHQTVDATSDDAGFDQGGDKSNNSGPTKTWSGENGQTNPITRQPFPASSDGVKGSNARQAYDDGTLEQNEQQGDEPVAKGGEATKGTQPADPVGDADKRVNLLEHTTSPANNSGPTTTWNGTDGNGVTKQQPPVTREPTKSDGINSHVIAVFKLADAEVDMGIIQRGDEKWERVAQLESLSTPEVIAQLNQLDRVRTAGLKKNHPQVGGRVPSLRTAAATQVESKTILDEEFDSALFSR